jgi:Xaa-Pro aminopeptidase
MVNKKILELIDNSIDQNGVDAFVQHKDGSDINHQYLTGFKASDPFTYLRYNGKSILLVPPVERDKAESQSDAHTVRSTTEFTAGDVRDNIEAESKIISDFLKEYEINRICTPRDFKLYLAEVLEKSGFSVQTIEDVVMEARKQKSQDEIQLLRTAQEATEKAMGHAKDILEQSEVVDGKLYYNNELLKSERLQDILREFLKDYDCNLNEVIVASGSKSADPHNHGSGPLHPNEPILFDIFPKHKSGYWGDMTRTFVKGNPTEEFEKMYETTKDAFYEALDVLSDGAGVTGAKVHNRVCDVFESAGYNTIRDGDFDTGFLHSTGHSIGRELHEPPRIVGNCGTLEEGYVLTIEPGLYNSEYGGVRIEDMVVVTDDGYENLNNFDIEYKI